MGVICARCPREAPARTGSTTAFSPVLQQTFRCGNIFFEFTSRSSSVSANISATWSAVKNVSAATATPHADLDLDPTSWLRRINHMVDHICEPICVRWFASCRSVHRQQGGSERALTSNMRHPAIRRLSSNVKRRRPFRHN
jgi:hypothetical protein